MEVFSSSSDEPADPRFDDMSFLKLTTIFFGLPTQTNANGVILRRINDRISSSNEPKPIVSVMRMLDKICREPDLIIRFSRTMEMMARHFTDSSNVPLSQADIGVRARLL